MTRPKLTAPGRVAMTCPFCSRPMALKQTVKFPRPGQPVRQFYGCSGWPECNATCGAHPDGSPSSSPADEETKAARVAAHDVFDKLWKGGNMSRNAAYARLQRLMGLSKSEAHIGFFTKAQCESLIVMLGQPEGVAR